MVQIDPLTGVPSAEVIDVVAYREHTRFQARNQILEVLNELIDRLARMGVGISAVISDEGPQSNPRREQIRALQAGLLSMSSACHDHTNIVVAIGSLKVITFNGNRPVNLADVKDRLMAQNPLNHLDPEVEVLLKKFWAHLATISYKLVPANMRLLINIEVISSLSTLVNNPWLVQHHLFDHGSICLVITLLQNLQRAQILMDLPINVDNSREMREVAQYFSSLHLESPPIGIYPMLVLD